MAKIPLGKILGVASGLGIGGGLGYGLSRRHDFAVVKARTPGGSIYLSGRRSDVEKLKDAAQSGDLKAFSEASRRVFVLGGSPFAGQVPPRMAATTGAQKAGMSRVAQLSQALEMAKTAGKLPGWALGLGGAALGAAAGGAGAYGVMRGRQFAAMNLQTPYGPMPVAGQRRRLEEIVSAAKHGDQQKFEQAMSRVVPLHPAMAGVIAGRPKEAGFNKLSALNASFFQHPRLVDLDDLIKEAGVWGSILGGVRKFGLKGINWLKGSLPKAEGWLANLGKKRAIVAPVAADAAKVKLAPNAAEAVLKKGVKVPKSAFSAVDDAAASTLKVNPGGNVLPKVPKAATAPAAAAAAPAATTATAAPTTAVEKAVGAASTIAPKTGQTAQETTKRWSPWKYGLAGAGILGGAGLVAGIHGLGSGLGSTVANTPVAANSFGNPAGPGF